jgi:hypothetical protein
MPSSSGQTGVNRRLAIGAGAVLVALAVLAGGLATWLESGDRATSLDPHHRGAGTAAGFAAAFCILALWRLRELGRGRTGWWEVAWCSLFAVGGLLFLDAVAFASRLGG